MTTSNTKYCLSCMQEITSGSVCPLCHISPEEVPWDFPALAPGTILNDKYLLGRSLGQGGFGITYIGIHIDLATPVAIKEFFPLNLVTRQNENTKVTVTGNSKQEQIFLRGLDRFRNEGLNLALFNHPNIIRVTDGLTANNTGYLVMEYVEGLTLHQWVKKLYSPMTEKQVFSIMMPIMDGLREIHKLDFLHRDIKPENILIDKNGRVILIDFGSARQVVSKQTQNITTLLTPGFAPPEQYSQSGKQGPWTDVFACGAVLF